MLTDNWGLLVCGLVKYQNGPEERIIEVVVFKGNNNKALYKFLLLHIHEVYYYM